MLISITLATRELLVLADRSQAFRTHEKPYDRSKVTVMGTSINWSDYLRSWSIDNFSAGILAPALRNFWACIPLVIVPDFLQADGDEEYCIEHYNGIQIKGVVRHGQHPMLAHLGDPQPTATFYIARLAEV